MAQFKLLVTFAVLISFRQHWAAGKKQIFSLILCTHSHWSIESVKFDRRGRWINLNRRKITEICLQGGERKLLRWKWRVLSLFFSNKKANQPILQFQSSAAQILNDWMAAWISYRVIVSCKHKTVLNWYCRAICRREMERGSWVNRRNLFSVVWWSFPPPPDSISSSITTAWKMLAIFLFFSMPATTAHNTRMLCNGLGGGERKRERERVWGKYWKEVQTFLIVSVLGMVSWPKYMVCCILKYQHRHTIPSPLSLVVVLVRASELSCYNTW